MINTPDRQYQQFEDGTWEARFELSDDYTHLGYGDTKEEADRKLSSSLKRHTYSITHTADGYFG